MVLSPHSRDFAEYGSILRRRWPAVLTCLVAGTLGGAALLWRTPVEYTAAAQVQVLPTGMQEQVNMITPRQREPLNLDTESQIAQSSVVASLAAQALKYPDSDALRENVEVDVPPNSAILSVSFTASDPESAAAGAQAFAEAYLRNRAAAATETLTAQQKAIAGQLREVNAALAKAAKDVLAQPRGSAEQTIASHRRTVLARQESSLTVEYDTLKTVAITPGTVISPARPPASPSAPSIPIYLGSGLFLGLLLGAGTAFARDRLDTRVREAADVERLTALPLLAEMPPRPKATVFHELAAIIVTALGDGYHTVLLESLGGGGHDRPLAKGVGAALAHLAPISVVTGRGSRPDAALLLAELGRTTSADIARAVRHLARQGVRVLGVVTLPPRMAVPVPDTAEPIT
ncbi:hypothetical protein Pth03_13080 [Planotetraspora thailandica]|uniref:Polysaccharide chain length determinant N-terminal domain-containing protein n=1 Tax=Planotetraspora thailandica TaxID=487172 RepID=A0A8J3V2M3_9ACTN|nr:hypothetical protein [Planotetraspora thailandica]GII52919.1 hypothetical protein Pth03_13080 [Planotetraspora thailandica]